jgi:hypothetical protein
MNHGVAGAVGNVIVRGRWRRLGDVQVDDQGLAHVVWSVHETMTRLDIYYAQLSPETPVLSEPLLVGTEHLPYSIARSRSVFTPSVTLSDPVTVKP